MKLMKKTFEKEKQLAASLRASTLYITIAQAAGAPRGMSKKWKGGGRIF